ncbi:MAG: hypothetical protein DPW14_17635, partial [Planctomycetes bacterium]|nr:hypothetical protein [Planctomycetota bacterium]
MNPFGTLVSADDALDIILAKLKPVSGVETVKLEDAAGCVLAEDVKSTVFVPAFDRAAMDGYAVIAEDLHEPAMLKVVGAAFAGKPYKGVLKRGECVEIATGAPIPKGADAVVMVESVQVVGQAVQFKQPARQGDHITRKGEDIAKNDTVVKKGTLLGPGQVAAIAITGKARIKVFSRPEVLLFTTGDEVVAPGKPLKDGQVYDCNSFAMLTIARRAGANVTYRAQRARYRGGAAQGHCLRGQEVRPDCLLGRHERGQQGLRRRGHRPVGRRLRALRGHQSRQAPQRRPGVRLQQLCHADHCPARGRQRDLPG